MTRLLRAVLILGLTVPASGALAQGAKKGEPPLPALPVSIAVADAPDGAAPGPVADDAWIDAQLAAAERLFGAHGMSFAVVSRRAVPAAHARLETRADRNALAARLEDGVINVFVVASLRDVDEPERLRMGVHWRKPKTAKHYVIVAASAMPSTLAHELGHFLGNPHTTVVDNLMSYSRSSAGEVFLDAAQGERSRRHARLYLRSRELLPR